uniref:Uncharacterized protein n=1 Tax=Streptomyces sp. NBC_00093 TaxID=2975649 RepID=A0AAU2A377_9ACTN
MSKNLTPREVLESYEAAAFRLSGVARRLLADNPDLPVLQVTPSAGGVAYQGGWATLQLSVDTEDDVKAWALVLGVAAETKFFDQTSTVGRPFLFFDAKAEIDGVEVKIQTSRTVPDEELPLWRGKQQSAAAGTPGGGE